MILVCELPEQFGFDPELIEPIRMQESSAVRRVR
jgi:hypothetical protein